MTIDALRVWHRAEPFRPFAIRTEANKTIPVLDPERLALSPWGDDVVVFGQAGGLHLLDIGQITAIIMPPPPPEPTIDPIPDLFA